MMIYFVRRTENICCFIIRLVKSQSRTLMQSIDSLHSQCFYIGYESLDVCCGSIVRLNEVAVQSGYQVIKLLLASKLKVNERTRFFHLYMIINSTEWMRQLELDDSCGRCLERNKRMLFNIFFTVLFATLWKIILGMWFDANVRGDTLE